MIKTTAKLRRLQMSPKKIRLVVDAVRGLPAKKAQEKLQFLNKKSAEPVLKLLNSAIANAVHNDKAKEETLKIAEIRVDEGKTLKRWRPRAFGRAGAIRKRSSHIMITLQGEAKEDTKKTKEPATADEQQPKKESVEEEKVDVAKID